MRLPVVTDIQKRISINLFLFSTAQDSAKKKKNGTFLLNNSRNLCPRMNEDELFARKLQQQFDQEAAASQAQEKCDVELAQRLANKSHDLSDTEDSEDEVVHLKHAKADSITGSSCSVDSVVLGGNAKSANHSSASVNKMNESCSAAPGALKHSIQNQSKRDYMQDQMKVIKAQSCAIKNKTDFKSVSPKHTSSSTKSSEMGTLNKITEKNMPSTELSVGNKESKQTLNKSSPDSGTQSGTSMVLLKESSPDVKPLCKYGPNCYRKNPIHLKEFNHTITKECIDLLKSKMQPINFKKDETQECSEPPRKKLKSANSTTQTRKEGFADRLAASNPYRIFWTKSFSIPATHKDPMGCVLPDLLNPSLGKIVETAQLSFLVDLDFVYTNYKSCGIAEKPLLLLYGELEGDTKQFTSGTFVKAVTKGLRCTLCELTTERMLTQHLALPTQVSMPFLYGTHHTKLILLLYEGGLRVVVHTANLRPDDWYEKTQGVWVSPLFPKLDASSTIAPVGPGTSDTPPSGDSATLFRQDLLQYLQSYKLSQLGHWCNVIRQHDFASCNAVFLGHVPGYHKGPSMYHWGHLKLRRSLARNTDASRWRGSGAVLQCSSIGSLGKDSTAWMSGELGKSLAGGSDCPSGKVQVVYPCEEDVRCSSQGWGGGSCLPYHSTTHVKQPWLQRHLHRWRSSSLGRTSAMPHIKTYTRLDSAGTAAQYLLLTSANLSKAAWGALQKQGEQLFIRSYEAGVLLLPKFVTGEDSFSLLPSSCHPLTLPYDLPLTPYPGDARPWFMDTKKTEKDINGDTYP